MSSLNQSMLAGVEKTVGKELTDKILSSKILLVGSGGIGCELLKNLALSGFRHVEAIDLDTIDVSNLNRQFLFRSQHVGKPKCLVACDAAKSMAKQANPKDTNIEYVPRHGNVCDDSKFSVPFVAGFDLVLNALDNVTARRRVNRLCLASNVPLVEAGTTGYLGQVKVIHKPSQTACYECKTQETQKVYPVCTIRSTPSAPVHTIVWAKELHKLLFGAQPEDSMLYETNSNEEGDDEEPSVYMQTVDTYRQTNKKNNKGELKKLALQILDRLYKKEIEKQLGMGRYKTAKKTPEPLSIDNEELVTPPTQKSSYKTTQVWSTAECVAEFVSCLSEEETPLPVFDKDDGLGMRFVTAASNLRSYVFGIEPIQSFYAAKGIAGNIIPAIATTNAIVAGLQVLQAFCILKVQLTKSKEEGGLYEACRYVDVLRNKTGRPGFLVSSSKLDRPNPDCFVCRHAMLPLTLNLHEWTLRTLLDTIIKKELGFAQPTILLDGDIVYEEGEGSDDFSTNLVKAITKLPCGGIQHGTVVRIEDFTQDLEVDVCVYHSTTQTNDDNEKGYTVGGEKPVAAAAKQQQAAEANNDDDDDDDDDIEILRDSRKRKTTGENGNEAKKMKPNQEDIIVID